jgi:Nucleoporin protein Ndc1-Nup
MTHIRGPTNVILARPHLYSFFRRRLLSIDSFSIVAHSTIASLYFACTSETANTLCDVYFSQVLAFGMHGGALSDEIWCWKPAIVSGFSNNPNKCLLNGIQSKDPYIQVRDDGLDAISNWLTLACSYSHIPSLLALRVNTRRDGSKSSEILGRRLLCYSYSFERA